MIRYNGHETDSVYNTAVDEENNHLYIVVDLAIYRKGMDLLSDAIEKSKTRFSEFVWSVDTDQYGSFIIKAFPPGYEWDWTETEGITWDRDTIHEFLEIPEIESCLEDMCLEAYEMEEA